MVARRSTGDGCLGCANSDSPGPREVAGLQRRRASHAGRESFVKSSISSLTRRTLFAVMLGTCIGVSFAAAPKEQKAIVQTGNGGPEVLKLQNIPVLEPGEGEVLIRVYAAAVNPTDWKARTAGPGYAPMAEAVIPGRDVAGVIEKIGRGVDMLKVGDPVFAVIARTAGVLNGGYS